MAPDPSVTNDDDAESAKPSSASVAEPALAAAPNSKAKRVRKALLRFVRSLPTMIALGSLNGIPTGYNLMHQQFRMPLDKAAVEIRRIIETEWQLQPDGTLKEVAEPSDSIPIFIESTYVIRGEQHYERALYKLYFSNFLLWSDKKLVVTVSFGGFHRFAKIEGDFEPYELLRKSWDKRVHEFLEHAGPSAPNRLPYEIKFGDLPDIPAEQINGPWRPSPSPIGKH